MEIPTPDAQQLREKMSAAFAFAQQQVRQLITRHPDFFPMYTEGGRWQHGGEAWTNWCEGFLGGMLWLFYRRTADETWRQAAVHYSQAIVARQHDREVHDLGFLFWSTWKRWYDLTGDPERLAPVITAGQTMGLRFQERGQYLRSFVAADSLFIDIMMNVGIVFFAALETKDKTLYDKAQAHCLTTRRYLVRGDGSTAHEGLFDQETGEFLRQTTHQGWRGDSAWARGQAWALYGFGTVYRLTGDRRFLETARACADFYLDHTDFSADAPGGAGIPPNDWDDPRQPVLYESSAAAIAASGLLNLSQAVQEALPAQRYRAAALTILETLCGPEYLADQTPGWEGILKHGIYHREKGAGVDESVAWGDHFFVEALDKALTLLEEEAWLNKKLPL
jgi:unsaturated chondroitin disaccharide hydrolase